MDIVERLRKNDDHGFDRNSSHSEDRYVCLCDHLAREAADEIQSLRQQLAECERERDAAYKTVDENWVSHQLVASMREMLKNRTNERDELITALQVIVNTNPIYGASHDIAKAALAKVGADKGEV